MVQVTISPISVTDFPEVLSWSKDETFCAANDWEFNREKAELYQWWLRCVQNQSSAFKRLGVEMDSRLIGYVDFACEGSYAEFGIAIGDSQFWGKGIGYTASKCALDFAQNNYGITTFGAETHETNNRSRKLLEKLGFQEISRNGSEIYLGVETALIQYNLKY